MEIQSTKGRWFKLTEAAQLLGVSEITVRRKAKTGQLKAILRNGKYLVQLEENAELGLYVGQADLPVASTLQMSNDRKQQFAQIARKENSEPKSSQDDVLHSLKRTIEDQQTLIASLEDSIARLSRRLASEQNSKK
jgi:predicted site-specific integrase-resolvase